MDCVYHKAPRPRRFTFGLPCRYFILHFTLAWPFRLNGAGRGWPVLRGGCASLGIGWGSRCGGRRILEWAFFRSSLVLEQIKHYWSRFLFRNRLCGWRIHTNAVTDFPIFMTLPVLKKPSPIVYIGPKQGIVRRIYV